MGGKGERSRSKVFGEVAVVIWHPRRRLKLGRLVWEEPGVSQVWRRELAVVS